ncbi:MAG: MATE family efflux transporter [Brevinema sp.]
MDSLHIKKLSRKIYPLILGIGIPASIRSTAQYIQQLIDSMYIGQYQSTSLAALGSISIPIWLFDSLWVGLGMSTTVMVAQRLGAKKQKDAAVVVKTSLIMGFFLSLFYLFMWKVLPLPQLLVRVMNLSPESAVEGISYISGFTWVYVFRILFYIIPASVLEAQGQTRVLLISGLIQSLANIILDPIFIWTLGLGIQGAAYATVIAEAIGATVICFYYWRGNVLGVHNIMKKEPLHWYVKERLLLAIPQSGMNISWSFVSSAAIMMINKAIPLGGAIFTVGFMLSDFSFRVLLGFDSAVTSLAGRAFGAKRTDRLNAVLRAAFVMKTYFGLSMIAILIIFREHIVRLFTNDPYIFDKILANMPWLILITVEVIYIGIFISVLHAMGKSRWNLVIGFICDSIRLSSQMFFLLVLDWGIPGAYMAIFIQEIVRYILSIAIVVMYFRRYHRQWDLKKQLEQDKPVLVLGQEQHHLR